MRYSQCSFHMGCLFRSRQTLLYSKQNIVGECFCVFYYANMLLSWVFVHKLCICVQMCLGYQDGQACIVTKHHLHVSFISSIMGVHVCWRVHAPTYRGLCWDTVSNISLLSLQPTSCRNLTTQQYTAILMRHNSMNRVPLNMASYPMLTSSTAEIWFDEGRHITLKACNLHVQSKSFQHYYSL